MRGSRDQVVKDPQVRAGLVGSHLDRRRPMGQRTGEEQAGGRGVPLIGQQDVDDLPVLVDGPVQAPPPAGDLDVDRRRRAALSRAGQTPVEPLLVTVPDQNARRS